MEELREIRGLQEIPDISFYLFVIAIVFALLIFGAVASMIYRYFKKRKEETTRKIVLQRLKDVDLKNSKVAAYEITKYARYLADEDRSTEIFSQLESKLQKYKYKKESDPLEKEAVDFYHLFLKVVDG